MRLLKKRIRGYVHQLGHIFRTSPCWPFLRGSRVSNRHLTLQKKSTSEADTLCQETMKSLRALPCLTRSRYVTKSWSKNSHDISPDVRRSLNILMTLCSFDLTVKCQQVINIELTVGYQLTDCLQQITFPALGSPFCLTRKPPKECLFCYFNKTTLITFKTSRTKTRLQLLTCTVCTQTWLLLHTSSNKSQSVWVIMLSGVQIQYHLCYWPEVRGPPANGVALHCYRVCVFGAPRPSAVGCVCVWGSRGAEEPTSILKPTKQDDFIVFSFHCPSPFRDVIC